MRRGYLREGLAWAEQFIADGLTIPCRIAKNIAKGALEEIHDPAVAEAIASLVMKTAKAHAESPFIPKWDYGQGDDKPEPPAALRRADVRRTLIDALVQRSCDESTVWWAAGEPRASLAKTTSLGSLSRRLRTAFQWRCAMATRESHGCFSGGTEWQALMPGSECEQLSRSQLAFPFPSSPSLLARPRQRQSVTTSNHFGRRGDRGQRSFGRRQPSG